MTLHRFSKKNEYTQALVLKVKVIKLNTNEGPAYGAAILAAVGGGLYGTVE